MEFDSKIEDSACACRCSMLKMAIGSGPVEWSWYGPLSPGPFQTLNRCPLRTGLRSRIRHVNVPTLLSDRPCLIWRFGARNAGFVFD